MTLMILGIGDGGLRVEQMGIYWKWVAFIGWLFVWKEFILHLSWFT